MDPLIFKYITSLPLTDSLPTTHKAAEMTLTEIRGNCKTCGKKLQDQRGKVTHHASCLDIESAGICKPCQTITWSRLRIYKDHILVKTDEGWNTIPRTKTSLIKKIIRFLNPFQSPTNPQ
jgi:hypothetical protein